MKNLLFFFFITSNSLLFSQFGEQQVISSNVNEAYLAIPFDVDNDGFIDVISAQKDTYDMVWFRNLDGDGTFSNKRIISTLPAYYLSISFADIDTDGDSDILFIGNNPRQLKWIEHLDGQGTFGEEHLIAEINYISNPIATDFDRDGDLDIVAKRFVAYNEKIIWYENTNGIGDFSSENIIMENLNNIGKLLLEDIDQDGLDDIIISHENDLLAGNLVWYKNLNNGSFSSENEIYSFEFRPLEMQNSDLTSISNFFYDDLDSDGLNDFIFTSYHEYSGTSAHWIKKMDSQGNFGSLRDLPTIQGGYNLYDVDNDGDFDIVGNDRFQDLIYWMENLDGLNTFSPQKIISLALDFPSDSQAADLDGDGLLDIIAASITENKVVWFKNTGILNLDENEFLSIKLFPNPTTGLITLKTSESIEKIIVRDVLGNIVLIHKTPHQIDISNYSSGVYFIEIINSSGISQIKKFLKK